MRQVVRKILRSYIQYSTSHSGRSDLNCSVVPLLRLRVLSEGPEGRQTVPESS